MLNLCSVRKGIVNEMGSTTFIKIVRPGLSMTSESCASSEVDILDKEINIHIKTNILTAIPTLFKFKWCSGSFNFFRTSP